MHVVILGGGPAGLAAAYELSRHKVSCVVCERETVVGGLARTIVFEGHRFDMGPHRFFTKNTEVQRLWEDLLGEDFLEVNRLTRILHNQKLFFYPLKAFDVLTKLGPIEVVRCLFSYIYALVRHQNADPNNFEEWTCKAFGRRLYDIFFKTYTEKVWGIPCSELSIQWAAQRIKGLSLSEAIKNAIVEEKGTKVRSLINRFYYPRLGCGMPYEALKQRIQEAGNEVLLNHDVTRIQHDQQGITGVEAMNGGEKRLLTGTHYLFSLPITHTVRSMNPSPPAEVLEAAKSLQFRVHISVNLIVKVDGIFPDQWIYIHSPEVKMARVANYRNFSPEMAPHDGTTGLTVEYFCNFGDDLWKMKDNELIELASVELTRAGLRKKEDVLNGFIIKKKDAYPRYTQGYNKHLSITRSYFNQFSNLQLIGRGGIFRYNNQDHAILTGLKAARNLLGGNQDVWAVNLEQEYHEEIQDDKDS